MPNDPKRLSVLADMESTIEGFTAGTVYHFTWDEVCRFDAPFWIWLDRRPGTTSTVAVVEEGPTTYEREARSGSGEVISLASMTVYVGVARRVAALEARDFDPFENTGDVRADVRSKMIADIAGGLMRTYTRGGNARDTRLVAEGPVLLDNVNMKDPANPTWSTPEWLAHELTFLVEYEFDEDSP